MTHSASHPASVKKWTFIHLSDIHLSTVASSGKSAEQINLRHELLEDIECLKDAGQIFDAMLVTGDIAYSGSVDQYAMADQFFADIQERSSMHEAAVWLIPGNHDVDRQVIRDLTGVEDFRTHIQGLDLLPAQNFLDRTLMKTDAEEVFLGPLRNYNAFAEKYDCDSHANQLAWHTDAKAPIILNDGSSLHIHGFNSSFACNGNEEEGRDLILGTQQYMGVLRRRGVINLVLCHHPQNWLNDGEDMFQRLNDIAHIVLFGHEHWPRHRKIDEMLLLNTGAVHPDGWEKYPPMYNVVSIWVDTDGEKRQLVIEVNRRSYRDAGRGSRFAEDNEGYAFKEVRLGLPSWTPSSATTTSNLSNSVSNSTSNSDEGGETVTRASHLPPLKKQVVFAYFGLPITQQVKIAQRLQLLTKEIEPLRGALFTHSVLDSAEEKNLLMELWHAIQEEQGHE